MPDFHYSERDDQVFPELFNKQRFLTEPPHRQAARKGLCSLAKQHGYPICFG